MIPFARVPLGEGGEVRCSRCHGAPSAAEYRSGDRVVEDLGRLAGEGHGAAANVVLSGAEPFGHPELPRIVTAAAAGGLTRVAIATDASALQSQNNAAGSLAAGVRHLEFRVLAATPGLHDALAGVSGRLEATLAGVRTFRRIAEAEGIRIAVTTVVPVCRHNSDELAGVVALAVEAGADRVVLTVDDPGMSLARTAPYVRAACDTGVVNGAWVEVDGMPFCLLPGYDLHVADTLRARSGAKSPVCATCGLDAVCGGAMAGASPDQLGDLNPPAGAEDLAARVTKSRGSGDAR